MLLDGAFFTAAARGDRVRPGASHGARYRMSCPSQDPPRSSMAVGSHLKPRANRTRPHRRCTQSRTGVIAAGEDASLLCRVEFTANFYWRVVWAWRSTCVAWRRGMTARWVGCNERLGSGVAMSMRHPTRSAVGAAVAAVTVFGAVCQSHVGTTGEQSSPAVSDAPSTSFSASVAASSAAASSTVASESVASIVASPPPPPSNSASTAASTPATTASTITAAVGYLHGHTELPIEAPTVVPGVPARSVLSATATADAHGYQVNLWLCSPVRPLNDPGVGNLDCGGEAQRFGSFGAQQEASPAAAQAALPGLANAQPARCQDTNITPTRSVATTSSGTQVTVWSCADGADPVEVRWSALGWAYDLYFGSSDWPQWRQLVDTFTDHLRAHPLPATPGVFAVTYAGDGYHSAAAWAVGSIVYTTFTDHSDTAAADLTAAMRFRTPG